MTTDLDRGPSAEASAALAAALPADTFAQVCGLGGLVVEVVTTPGAALWRGHPWGTGWAGGGDRAGVAVLVQQVRPAELTLPATLPLPDGYRRGWGWGWHALRTPPARQPHEDRVAWLDPDDAELADLVSRAFPDAETPPGDPRVDGWFGARDGVGGGGRLVTAAASLRLGPDAAVLSSLTVDPTARRAGWARAVTAWFVRERLAAGVRVVGLGTYLSNAPARALYTRLGFLDVPYAGGVREG